MEGPPSPSKKPHDTKDADQEAPVHFRPRRRPHNSRKRLTEAAKAAQQPTAPANDDPNCEANMGPSRADLLLLREAQQLRERNRITALDISVSGSAGTKPEANKTEAMEGANDIANGLKSHFSVEQSSLALEERMDKYIEEGMRKKFGEKAQCAGVSEKPADVDEAAIFEIPDWLQVKERPVYDPSEGMPSAGLEEVSVPEEERTKTAIETIEAQKNMAAKKAQSQNATKTSAQLTTGNLSSNFAQHRSEWIENHFKSRSQPPRNDTEVRDKEKPTRPTTLNDSDQNGNQNSGKRFSQATDAAFAERFRKRWRR